ncbi:MAG TPA: 2Fe-2S iron-sulfur cluster-binding protein, partial [Nitrospira sp.]|nr:2Fe-2S iron-sulfur cluster-binding protein [Nitrospira sp.]
MKLSINGRPIEASPGDTIYVAAKKAGIAIPALCTSDHLAPFGSCRMCLCEVEGQGGTPASCTTPVREGMVVHTESDRVRRLRKHLLELYLSEQPSGDLAPEPLQRLAQSLGLRHVRYQQPATRAQTVDRSNPFFLFDNAVCISCARCVRACDDIQGTHALTMLHRGFESRPTAGGSALTGESAGFASSNCVSCGACVKECPTGALIEKSVLEEGPPMHSVRTTCAYCGVGCSFEAGVRHERVVRMVPADDGP